MNFKTMVSRIVLVIIAAVYLTACGESTDNHKFILNGSITIDETVPHTAQPLVVYVAKGDSLSLSAENANESTLALVNVDNTNHSFSIDLSQKGLKTGDRISIVAFIDNNYDANLPTPDKGDYIGFYIDAETFSTDLALKPGSNDVGAINLKREVFSFEKNITGTITNIYTGDVLLIAYAGEINSMDFDSLDFDEIIGFKKIVKTDTVTEYTMPVMPYGYNLPIKDLYVLALYDSNSNGISDSGDYIDFYKGESGDMPVLITLDNDETSGTNINFKTALEVTDPSPDRISVSGTITLPDGFADADTDKPLFIIAAKADTPGAIMSSVSDIKYFEKLSVSDAVDGKLSYSINLSETDLVINDTVMMIALWDLDYESGFPDVTFGDKIGFYTDTKTMSTLYTLKDSQNADVDITVSRDVYSYEKKISGKITADYQGDIILVAYNGEINSLNFSSFDIDKVVGYKTLTKTEGPLNYELTILPFGQNLPIENVYVLALCDANKNGITDSGDFVGYYTGSKGTIPELLTLTSDASNGTGIDINSLMQIATPSADTITLSGRISLPENYTQNNLTKPVFIIVSEAGSAADIMSSADNIKYFEKFSLQGLSEGEFDYSIDLSATDLLCGQEVMVTAVWDLDYVNGFPDPTKNDMVGFYINSSKMSASLDLKCGDNTDINVKLSRKVYTYEKDISGTISGDYTGSVMVVAYTGEINSLSFDTLDFDKVIGYDTFIKTEETLEYSLRILPYGYDLPIKDIYILAFFDSNESGVVDNTDYIGYYTGDKEGIPALIEVTKTSDSGTGIDLSPQMQVTAASSDSIQISGAITLPQGFDAVQLDKPLFIIVSKAGSTGALSSSAASIKYFEKFPMTGETDGKLDYTIDISGTDLSENDEVMVAALWDLDYINGFPEVTSGDYIGIYYPADAITASLNLQSGLNENTDISVNRKVWDYETSVSGTIAGSDSGIVTVVAYSGEITSSDFSTLDMDKVIGYNKFRKGSEPIDYTLDILPYGENLPIENVFIMAFLDTNENNAVDGADKIGFYMNADNGLPKLITITEEPSSAVDLIFAMNVPTPCDIDMSIKGSFKVPDGYNSDSPPFYLVLLDANNLDALTAGSMSSIKYFYKMPPGEFYYDLDISGSGICPGDTVMLAALWDKDFKGGFPGASRGDWLGIVQNKDEYSMMVQLNYGENIIPRGDYKFDVDKKVYDFDASIGYAIDMQLSGSWDSEKGQILAMTVHVDGVDVSFTSSGSADVSIDMDYVLGFKVISPVSYDNIGAEENRVDPDPARQMDIFTALYKNIIVWEESDPDMDEPLIRGNDYGTDDEATAYLIGVLDKDGDFNIDSDDEIGYYGQQSEETGDTIFIPGVGPVENPFPGASYFLPEPVKRIIKGENIDPRDGVTAGPYWIRMNAASNIVQQ